MFISSLKKHAKRYNNSLFMAYISASHVEITVELTITMKLQKKIVEPDIAEDICEEETTEKSERGLLVKETSDPEVSVEEFTRRRIRDMLQIISRRKPQIKGHIHL